MRGVVKSFPVTASGSVELTERRADSSAGWVGWASGAVAPCIHAMVRRAPHSGQRHSLSRNVRQICSLGLIRTRMSLATHRSLGHCSWTSTNPDGICVCIFVTAFVFARATRVGGRVRCQSCQITDPSPGRAVTSQAQPHRAQRNVRIWWWPTLGTVDATTWLWQYGHGRTMRRAPRETATVAPLVNCRDPACGFCLIKSKLRASGIHQHEGAAWLDSGRRCTPVISGASAASATRASTRDRLNDCKRSRLRTKQRRLRPVSWIVEKQRVQRTHRFLPLVLTSSADVRDGAKAVLQGDGHGVALVAKTGRTTPRCGRYPATGAIHNHLV